MRARTVRAAALLRVGEAGQAYEDAEGVLALDSLSVPARMIAADALIMQYEIQEAVTLLQNGLVVDPDNEEFKQRRDVLLSIDHPSTSSTSAASSSSLHHDDIVTTATSDDIPSLEERQGWLKRVMRREKEEDVVSIPLLPVRDDEVMVVGTEVGRFETIRCVVLLCMYDCVTII
jgi:hypothetical protein